MSIWAGEPYAGVGNSAARGRRWRIENPEKAKAAIARETDRRRRDPTRNRGIYRK